MTAPVTSGVTSEVLAVITSAGAWQALDVELAHWAAMDRKAALWLRDDDAIQPTPALDRLLELASDSGVPLALAVIPAGATAELAYRLAGLNAVSVLQHGLSHANHAFEGVKKSEFAEQRPLDAMKGELVDGRARLLRLFGDAALPVLAPPWNRVANALVGLLPEAGLSGLSRYKARASAHPAKGVLEVNTHVDVIEWRNGKTGASLATILGEVTAHLAAKRQSKADIDEPTGILTHHLAMDGTAWATLEGLFARLGPDSRVAWQNPRMMFEGGIHVANFSPNLGAGA